MVSRTEGEITIKLDFPRNVERRMYASRVPFSRGKATRQVAGEPREFCVLNRGGGSKFFFVLCCCPR